ncbi:hypothetical protein [Nocardia sp. CC227C]|nr:hypothetical protein [Nocardia sp. CC227C]
MTILAECARAVGEPMTWWQALLVTLACFAVATAIALLVFRGRQ